MKKIWITFSTSFKSLMNLNQNFNINSFMCSFFHILMNKTNYDQLENFKGTEKKIEQVYEINYDTVQKQKKILNNSLSVNPLQLPDIMEVDSLRGKTF